MVVHSASSVMGLMIEEADLSTSWRQPGLVWLHIGAWVVHGQIWSLKTLAVAYELTIDLETFSVKPTELEPLKQLHTESEPGRTCKGTATEPKDLSSQASTHLSPPYLWNILANLTATNKRVVLYFWLSLTHFTVFK